MEKKMRRMWQIQHYSSSFSTAKKLSKRGQIQTQPTAPGQSQLFRKPYHGHKHGLSRHLADKWASTYVNPWHKRRLIPASGLTEIAGIEHFILLDLLGAPNPTIRSYFADTAWLFDAVILAEARLGESGAFTYTDSEGVTTSEWRSFFRPRSEVTFSFGGIGDDHEAFLKKGVNVLHVIPEPFPRVWHTLQVN
jgi:glutaminyl-peptide cyclotransferase